MLITGFQLVPLDIIDNGHVTHSLSHKADCTLLCCTLSQILGHASLVNSSVPMDAVLPWTPGVISMMTVEITQMR